MLKFAIVGTGIIVKSHLRAISESDNAKLVCVCDINEEKAMQYSKECGVPYVLDYKELPSKFDFDAVILNLPHGLHCEVAEFFLNAGKHVLVEKPMANTVEECERMILCAKKNNKKLAIAHIQRYFPSIQIARKMHETGELGKLCMYTENRCNDYFNETRPRWFLSQKSAGGGIAMNFAAHAFDKLLSIMPEAKISSIDAQCGNYKNDFDVEGHAQIFAKFDNGVSASITLFGYAATGYEAYLYFTNGALKIMNQDVEINRGDGNGFVPMPPLNDKFAFTQQIEDFIALTEDKPSNIPTGEYGLYIIKSIQESYKKSTAM